MSKVGRWVVDAHIHSCSRVEWRRLRFTRWLTLFFIPVCAYSTMDVAVCRVCK